MTRPSEVLEFWRGIGPKGWYAGGDEVDEACRRFAPAWEEAREGGFRDWLTRPETALAYLILTDQIPRNIHRGSGLSFATDTLAFSAATQSVALGHDLRTEGDIRQFFYLPYEHAESRQAQAICVALFLTRMPEAKENLLHARVHREVIRRFGRFPYRNEALGRTSSLAEERFLKEEGYGAVLKALSP